MSGSRAPVPAADVLLAVAEALARQAGELILVGRARAGDEVDVKSSPTDVVTAMDRASERLLVTELGRLRPDDAVLGEEGAAREGTSGVRWVLDPIDGTVNYLYGLPWYAVSVAAEVDGVVAAGVVFQPESGELFRALRGGGAWLGETRLHCPPGPVLSQALVSTGFGYDAVRRAGQATVAAALLPQVRDLRRLGSAALDLCQLAAGRVDAHYEAGLSYWDHAAGALIAAEAGAVVDWLYDAAAGADCIVAAGPDLHPVLRDVLSGLLDQPRSG